MAHKTGNIVQFAIVVEHPIAAHDVKCNDEQAHHDNACRGEACRDLTFQQTIDCDRTNGNANGKHGQKQTGNFFVRAQYVFCQRWKLNEKHRADCPEKADRQYSQIQRFDVHGRADQFHR